MRPEKKYLVEAVGSHLDKSNYVFLTNFERISVAETADLRNRLEKEGAEFHVVKNSLLNIAAKERNFPDLKPLLEGPIAIVVGGDNPSGVAKVLKEYFKEKDKVDVKGGVLEDRALTPEQIEALAKLPGMEVLRAQLLGLLNQPASMMVQILAAVPRSMVQVLHAKATEEN